MKVSQRAIFSLLVCLPLLSSAQPNPGHTQSSEPTGATTPSTAQAPPLLPRPAPAPVAKKAEGRIQLDVVVTDKAGKPVSGLDRSDFTLLDDNQPARILSFQAFDGSVHKVAPPVEVILLIDIVNLPFQQVATTRSQIEDFLRQNAGHLAYPTSVYFLTNAGVNVPRAASTNGIAMAAEIDKQDVELRTIGRAAGFYGAMERLQLSIKALTAIADIERKKPGRKLLIWAGSGWPMMDSVRIEISDAGHKQYFDSIVELSTALRQARIDLSSMSLGTAGSGTFLYEDFLKGVKTADKANLPNLALRVLSIQSGGRVLGPDNDLTAQIDKCIGDAESFYTLSFDPPRADRANEFHDLKVRIDKPGLTARTNTGYYNQPESSAP
jgi:VWFA-related protein